MWNIGQHEEKKCLMVHVYLLDKVLDKIKETIPIKKIHDTKILTDADDKWLYKYKMIFL